MAQKKKVKLTITEKQANDARNQYSEFLRQAGAHAITVDQIVRGGNKMFAVIVMIKKKSPLFPKELEVKSGRSKVRVPLVVKVRPQFKLE